MTDHRGTRFPRLRPAVLGVLAAAVLLVTQQALPAGALTVGALTVGGTPTPVTGNATYFNGLGSPYGGCGLPQAELDTQNFVALNVFDTPGDYTSYPRPVPPADAGRLGMFDNGLNCGRFVQVTIGDYCTGTNDGARDEPFCRNGSWVSDAYNGATLTMEVADSCADGNAWCRDDPYHLDLAKGSLNAFVKDGAPVGDMYPDHWNNRHVTWQFVPAPDYRGDIRIGFLRGAQTWWGAIAVSHLPGGIHGVDYYADGSWHSASMNSDMGQSYIIDPTVSGGTDFTIRVIDASDQLVNDGRVYSFSLPSSCGSQCGAAYTGVDYTTSTGPTAPPTTQPPTTAPPTTAPPTTQPPTSAGCTVSAAIVNSWQGGYQLGFTVTNTGSTPTAGWRVPFTFPGSQTISTAWSASISGSGPAYTATNVAWNGTVPPGGTTTFGMTVSGPAELPTTPTCRATP